MSVYLCIASLPELDEFKANLHKKHCHATYIFMDRMADSVAFTTMKTFLTRIYEKQINFKR